MSRMPKSVRRQMTVLGISAALLLAYVALTGSL